MMQQTIKTIVKAFGFQGALSPGGHPHFHLKIVDTVGTLKTLLIQKCDDRVSVAHLHSPSELDILYSAKHLCDQEIVYKVVRRQTPDLDDLEYWEPVELNQHSTNVYRSKYSFENQRGRFVPVLLDPNFEDQVGELSNYWAWSLARQMERTYGRTGRLVGRLVGTSLTHVRPTPHLADAMDQFEMLVAMASERQSDCSALSVNALDQLFSETHLKVTHG